MKPDCPWLQFSSIVLMGCIWDHDKWSQTRVLPSRANYIWTTSNWAYRRSYLHACTICTNRWQAPVMYHEHSYGLTQEHMGRWIILWCRPGDASSGHLISPGKTAECRYNAVQFITILHNALRWQQLNVNQTSNSQQTPHSSPSRARYGVAIMRILKKIDRVITTPHYMWLMQSLV